MMTLTFATSSDLMFVAVRHAAPPPAGDADIDPAAGLGLYLISTTACHWGLLTDRDDTIIWAAIRR
jgi:hypothetical protein